MLTFDDLKQVPGRAERPTDPSTINRWKADEPCPVAVSGKHRTMIHTWQLAMEMATPKGETPPSVREATELLVEMGWTMAHLPVERRIEIIQEARNAARNARTTA